MPDDPLTHFRELRPLRDLPRDERCQLGVCREGRARPRRIEHRPARDDYHERLAELRDAAAQKDPLVTAKDQNALVEAMREIAVEAAAVKFERVKAEREGKDPSGYCSRRVSALAGLAALVVDRARWQSDDLDVRSDRFQKIVTYFMDVLKEVAAETLGPDAERFLAAYESRIVGWADTFDPPPPRGRAE